MLQWCLVPPGSSLKFAFKPTQNIPRLSCNNMTSNPSRAGWGEREREREKSTHEVDVAV